MYMKTGSSVHLMDLSVLIYIFKLSLLLSCGCNASSKLPKGHLKPFGCCNPANDPLAVSDGWPRPVKFLKEHVIPREPVLLKDAAKVSPAYDLWTDHYFSKMSLPRDAKVNVKAGKKEVMDASPELINFKDWIRQYKTSDKYLEQGLPAYLGKDIVLPPSLQCSNFIKEDMLAEEIIWFSSGETKSLVKTNEFHGLNCVYAGTKQFILVDPALHGEKFPSYDPKWSRSIPLDVDRVDFEKYPELADVEYHNVTVEAGDCLFVPAFWVHQVNSFGRNIVVNVLFHRDAVDHTDPAECFEEFYDDSLTLNKIAKRGRFPDVYVLDGILAMMRDIINEEGRVAFQQFHNGILKDHMEYVSQGKALGYAVPLNRMFQCWDKNFDDVITEKEFLYEEERDETAGTFSTMFIKMREILRVTFENRPDHFSTLFQHLFEVVLKREQSKDTTNSKKTDVKVEL